MEMETELQSLLEKLSPTKFEEGSWNTHSDESIAYFKFTHTHIHSPNSDFVYDREVYKVSKNTGKGGLDLTIESPNNRELSIDFI